MSDSNDFKKLWNKQEASAPDTKELFNQSKKFKMKSLRKIIVTNILFILTAAFIVYVWYSYQPAVFTTKLGIIIVLVAMFVYLFVYNQMIPFYKNIEFNVSNSQYLQQLLKLKEKQRFLFKTALNIYFIMLSTGIALYMIEFAGKMTVFSAILSYGLTFLWIGISWFVFRPRTIKKQNSKLNELIDKFEGLNKQLSQNE